MSVRAIGWAFEQGDLSPTNKLVLIALADNANDEGICWPGWEAVSRKTGLSRASVYRAYGALKDTGLLRESVDARGRELKELDLTPRLGVSEGDGESHCETPYIEEPSKEPSENQPPSPPAAVRSQLTAEVESVWATYVEVMNPRGRGKQLAPDARKIIREALKVGSPEELARAIETCGRSDWHMKRGKEKNRVGGKHNSIGSILKPRATKGQTWRSRLEWWLDKAEELEQGKKPEFDVNAEAERIRREQEAD